MKIGANLRGVSAMASIVMATTGALAESEGAAGPNEQTPGVEASASTPLADNDGVGLDDIIVTAQRRSESLQKTALSISVAQPEALASAGITSPTQLTVLLPQLQVGNFGPASSPFLRGVGSLPTQAAQSPAIPYYTDGVYVARAQSVQSEFYDVERLEVLKGPQGTLYGRNASGGAINIITQTPTLNAFKVRGELEIGNFGNQSAELAVNVPLSPTMALRASGKIVDKGGYTSIGLGDDKYQSARIKLLWEPSSDVSLILNGSYGHIGGRGPTWVILNKDVPGWYPRLDSSDPRTQAYVLSRSAFGPNPPPGFIRPTQADDQRQDLEFFNISGALNWNLSENIALDIIAAYRNSHMQYTTAAALAIDTGYGFADEPAKPETSDATSVEVRLSGDSEQLKWVAGLFYYNEDQYGQYSINGGFPQHIGIQYGLGTRSYAAFGEATYSLTDRVRVIGGLRYTSDRRSISDGEFFLISPQVFLGPTPPLGAACAFPAPTQPSCLIDTYAGKKTFGDFSWKGGLEADVFQDSLFYITASRGFKAGGFNTQSTFGSPGRADVFQPETLISYDVGLKNRLLNNRLQLNVTGFYWNYRDHQEPKIGPTNAGTLNLIYYNAGKATIYGGNIEVVANPWRGATLTGQVEYANASYDDFSYNVPTFTFNPATNACPGTPSPLPGQTTVDCSGFQTVKTPKWSGGVGFTQEVPVGDSDLIFNANMTFASARWLSIDFTPLERAKGYALLDTSLTYRGPQGAWSITGFVRNVTNANIYTNALQHPFAFITVGNINPPRTYGARLAFNF